MASTAAHMGDEHPLLRVAAAHAVQAEQTHTASEFRRKFNSKLEDTLDYLHYHPSALEQMATTLLTIFGNVVDHPEEEKYRRVKDANRAWQGRVMSVKRADGLVLMAHWRPRVVDMEKSWVFEYPADSQQFHELSEARAVLVKVVASLHDKAERKRQEEEGKKGRSTAEKERLRLQLEDDRVQRAMQAELKVVTGTVRANPLPSEDPDRYGRRHGEELHPGLTGYPGAAGAGGGQHDDEDEEEEEEEAA